MASLSRELSSLAAKTLIPVSESMLAAMTLTMLSKTLWIKSLNLTMV